jgi:hypothetical protein
VIATVVPTWSSTSGGPFSVKHTTVGKQVKALLNITRLLDLKGIQATAKDLFKFFPRIPPPNITFGFPVVRVALHTFAPPIKVSSHILHVASHFTPPFFFKIRSRIF